MITAGCERWQLNIRFADAFFTFINYLCYYYRTGRFIDAIFTFINYLWYYYHKRRRNIETDI